MFSKPNRVEMDTCAMRRRLTGPPDGTGQRQLLKHVFKGGVGEYELDFSGELKRDATVSVDAGLSSIRIIVPEGMAARVIVDPGCRMSISTRAGKNPGRLQHERGRAHADDQYQHRCGNLQLSTR